jgi:hypothetical protein
MKHVWEAEENGKDGGRSRQGMAGRTMRGDFEERMNGCEIVFLERKSVVWRGRSSKDS